MPFLLYLVEIDLVMPKKFCRLVLVLAWILVGPCPTWFCLGGAQEPSHVASLIDKMRDKSAVVRRDAAVALSRIGAAAKDAVPQLITPLKDPDRNVRSGAASALRRIGPAKDDAGSEKGDIGSEKGDIRIRKG
jgi:hypothetical protein